MVLLRHECKQNVKILVIWSLAIGLICYGCILLYQSLADSIAGIADTYAKMGDMSKAIGLDKVSIATLDGYFATEITIMFGLGAGMFASMLGVGSLSKEEEGHTSEFLYTLPHSRIAILACKFVSLLVMLVIFNLVCMSLETLGLCQSGQDFSIRPFLTYHALAFVMQFELTSICFLISALSRRRQLGAALGLTLLFYVMDMMCRIVPDIDFLKYFTPYYFANGSDIFSKVELNSWLLGLALAVSGVSLILSFAIYQKRDLTA
ncbi:ABC transporter permease subunit [Streptococcus dentiloxodontae]